jgi:F0F1-type ATP synthase membrane subunit a
MVVLETASPTSAIGLLDPLDSYNSRSSMKLLPKRFINVHQWLGPICAKQLKETLVSKKLAVAKRFCTQLLLFVSPVNFVIPPPACRNDVTKHLRTVGFEVLLPVVMSVAIFWDIVPCS